MSFRLLRAVIIVFAIGCATNRPPLPEPTWEEVLATEGWANALVAVSRECPPSLKPLPGCGPEDWRTQEDEVLLAREAAYQGLLEAFPLTVEVGIASHDELAALSEHPVPGDIDEHVLLLTTRVRFPTMPARVSWSIVRTHAFLRESRDETLVYRHSGDAVEGFVVALGGPVWPSTRAAWQLATSHVTASEYRERRWRNFVSDEKRYGIPSPQHMPPASAPRRTITHSLAEHAPLLAMGALPITVLIDMLTLSNATPRAESPEYRLWWSKVEAKRTADHAEWARDPAVDRLVRIFAGVGSPPASARDPRDLLGTFGYAVDRSLAPRRASTAEISRGPIGGEVLLELRPLVDGAPLPSLWITVKVPRSRELRMDLDAFARTGPHRVVPRNVPGVATWNISDRL